MLGGLDEVDWGSLTHAYGSAEDVPGLLRDLLSHDEGVREEALYELFGNIYHQGSRYEASAYAVPFLLEMLDDPATPDRVRILELLSGLAVGDGEAYLATGVPDRDLWPADEAAVYEAVAGGMPLLLELAGDTDAELAGQAIQTLSWYPDHAAEIVPTLVRIAGDERQPVALAAAATMALGLVLRGRGTHDFDPLLTAHLHGDEASLRWSAAVAWAHIAGSDLPVMAVDQLRAWADGSWSREADLSLRLLDSVAPGVAREVRLALTTAVLAEEPKSNWHNHFNAVLAHAFPYCHHDHGLGFAELTAAQRAVVTWLVEHPEVFGPTGPAVPLRMHGLPYSHQALISYAADFRSQ